MEQTQFSFLLQAKGDELIYTSYFKATFFFEVAMKTNSPPASSCDCSTNPKSNTSLKNSVLSSNGKQLVILFIVRIGILHTLILATLNYRDPLWGEDEALLTSLGQTPTGMAKR